MYSMTSKEYIRRLEKWFDFAEKYFYTPLKNPDIMCFGTGESHHWAVQANMTAFSTVAVLAMSPELEEKNIGISRSELQKIALKLLRYSIRTHKSGTEYCTNNKQWGLSWISGLSLERMRHGYEAIEELLDSNDRNAMRRIMEAESNFLLDEYEIKAGFGYYENKPIIEVPASRFQVPAEIHIVNTTYNVADRDVFDTSGRIVFTTLISDLAIDTDRNKLILDLLYKIPSYTIVISERTSQLEYLHEKVPDSIYINGKTPKKQREKKIEEFRNGKYKVLFATYSLVAEGLDIPILENLIMASPVKDERLVIQAIGRCQRPSGEKRKAIVYDLVDDVSILYKFTSKRRSVYKKEGWDIL